MTDVLRIAHPQNCPPYGNSRVGICEGNLLVVMVMIRITQGGLAAGGQWVAAGFRGLWGIENTVGMRTHSHNDG